MGYVSVRGGEDAIRNADMLFESRRLAGTSPLLTTDQIIGQLGCFVDRVMSEGGLYSPLLASLAIKQSQGDPIEASFYIRAYRTTLPRLAASLPINTESMFVLRRISAAFKDIPGGQILGPNCDYRQRLLDFSLLDEKNVELGRQIEPEQVTGGSFTEELKRVSSVLREQGILEETGSDPDFDDITLDPPSFPMSRSGRLASLARGETGSMTALAYANMRGFGSIHPTVGELRVGCVTLEIEHPYRKGERVSCGRITITECEIIAKQKEDDEGKPGLTLGYGCCFGSNETKAISMATLDRAMRDPDGKNIASDEEFVITHIDGIEASGFAAHFKLPHYITFQSSLDAMRKAQEVHASAAFADEHAVSGSAINRGE